MAVCLYNPISIATQPTGLILDKIAKDKVSFPWLLPLSHENALLVHSRVHFPQLPQHGN
jgi:hypothetical protein